MRRYLIVDDNQAFAENVAEILTDAGAEVTIVAGGPQALEAARSRRFDALVTDMRMPVMSGARLVHEIRAVDPGLPAIVVTAYTGEDDLLAARDEGLLAVLPKPAPIPRLLELLRNARRDGLVALVEDDPALADNLAEALRARRPPEQRRSRPPDPDSTWRSSTCACPTRTGPSSPKSCGRSRRKEPSCSSPGSRPWRRRSPRCARAPSRTSSSPAPRPICSSPSSRRSGRCGCTPRSASFRAAPRWPRGWPPSVP